MNSNPKYTAPSLCAKRDERVISLHTKAKLHSVQKHCRRGLSSLSGVLMEFQTEKKDPTKTECKKNLNDPRRAEYALK